MKIFKSIVAGALAAAIFVGVGSAIELTKNHLVASPENTSNNLILPNVAFAQTASGVAAPACYDNYQSWNSSTTIKTDSDWSTIFMPPYVNTGSSNKYYNNFERDINGDGLPDYIFTYHYYQSTGSWNQMADCVYLSNGHGWDLAYRCVNTRVSSTVTYYGNCAA